jgi:hypothetical protein
MNATVAQQLSLFSWEAIPGETAIVGLPECDERSLAEAQRRRGERGLSVRSLVAREHREGEFKGRKALILDVLRMAQKPMTDRQIKERLFGENADMNMVRPRVNDLIQEGKVREFFEVVDHVTGEMVRAVWLG